MLMVKDKGIIIQIIKRCQRILNKIENIEYEGLKLQITTLQNYIQEKEKEIVSLKDSSGTHKVKVNAYTGQVVW